MQIHTHTHTYLHTQTRPRTRAAVASIIISACIALVVGAPGSRAHGQSGEPSGGATSVQSCVVAGSVPEVWALFATSDGLRSWVAPLAEVDLRIGGSWRTNYNPDGVLGDDTTIVSEILCYESERMLCLRNTTAPKGFAHADALQETWSIIRFEAVDTMRTRISLTGFGWGDDPAAVAARAYFDSGNTFLLKRLQSLFDSAGAAKRSSQVLELANQMAGNWIHESTSADGAVFRAHNLMAAGPDGRSVVGRSALGDSAGMFDHGTTIMHIAPASTTGEGDPGAVVFYNINERGDISTGQVTLRGDDTLVWVWNQQNISTGDLTVYHVEQTLDLANDSYTMRLAKVREDGTQGTPAEIVFTRVDDVPERFAVMGD